MADHLAHALPAVGSKDDVANFLPTYQYAVSLDLRTSVIIGFSLSLFFCVLDLILNSFFYWIIYARIYNAEEATALTSPANDDFSLSQQGALFQALVLSNMQAWLMVGALMEESENVDEPRGETLRAMKKLPALVKYRSLHLHDNHVTRNCVECVICLEDFKEGELCQVFPGCNHLFHFNCIDCWLAGNLTCPTCRSSITY